MGVAGNSIEILRKVFRRSSLHNPPLVVQAGNSIFSAYNNGGYDLLSSGGFGYHDYLSIEQDLVSRYIDYEDMDQNPLVASAHDIYADDALQHDKIHNRVIWVECDDEAIRKDLNDLLHKKLNVEERIWGETRGLVKYGNSFSEIVARDKDGVVAVNQLAAPTVRRIEIPADIGSVGSRDFNSNETLGFVYDPRGSFRLSTRDFLQAISARSSGKVHSFEGAAIFEGWEVMHTRLLGKHPDAIYGSGISEPARWLYKRLSLLEDSIILHRLTRAPSRHAFYIDVTSIPPNEVGAYLNRVKQGLKKQKFVNPTTGKLDVKYNVASNDEDFFLPVRDGKESTRVETLQGPVYDAIEDIKYFENKLFAALKVPKPFLTYEESTAKTNLSAEDSRFARTVMRIQREIRNGYHKLCRVHLAARGVNPDAVEFSVNMTIPSAIFELAQLEIKNAELELADKFQAYAPKEWIMQNILKFSNEQIDEMQRLSDAEGSEEMKETSGASGALEQALAKRGQRRSRQEAPSFEPTAQAASTPPLEEPPQEAKRYNGRVLLEQVSELRHKNKEFDRNWERLESFMKEVRSSLRSK